MIRKYVNLLLIGLVAGALPAVTTLSDDWPTYKRDAARTSASTESLKFPLAKRWAYQPSQPPRPAWPEPGKELNRVDFDYAFQPVVAGGLVYFGSSADNTVRALNAETGELVWRFITDGPVRFAPAIAHGKAYITSDDGCLYCLDAKTGKRVWRFRCAPNRDRIIGNDRLIARYPCRTGALVVDKVVYVTAGMWPTEGVYVYALDADTGKEIWCNDSSGNIYTDLPHAVANGFSGVAPQGYLVASRDVLLVPTGRSVPAAFDRRTGRLLYYKPEKTHYHGASYGGGVWCTAAGDLYFHPNNRFYNPSEPHTGEADPCSQDGMIVYSFVTGDQQCYIPGRYRVLVAGDVIYAAGNGSIDAIDLNVVRKKRRIGPKDATWSTPHAARVYSMAMAGGTVLTGNRDGIKAFNAADGKPVWSVELNGQQVRGMAVANGRLLAATHTGALLCFGPGDAAPRQIKEGTRPSGISGDLVDKAKGIVQRSGKTEGYALVVGEPDSRLAEALARQTQLRVVSLVPDTAQAAAERERLLNAGLLGSRVAVHIVENPARLNLPPYFADLVVVSGRERGISAKECYRALRPCGGVLCFVGFDDATRKEFVARADIPQEEVDAAKRMIVRGKLPGAGEWRYPWADGGRSGVGKESRVRFPVQLLWFGGPGPGLLVDRHLMGSPPISTHGRVFMAGVNDVIAFDAYNGRDLWTRHIEGVGRKYAQYYSSGLVADADSVYVIQSDKCRRLDQATGKILTTYTIPKTVVKGAAPPALPDYLDIEWPKAWQVIGPFPKGKPPLSGKALKELPERITVKGKEYVASELKAVKDILDFTTLFGGYGLKPPATGRKSAAHPRRGKRFSFHDVGRIGYAFAKIRCPQAGKLLIGAGADWGMRWYLDGELVFDALRNDGSARRRGYFTRAVCSPRDRVFDVDVTAGEHTLAVMVTAGGRGWAMASASMAKHAKEVMPVAAGENPNVPDLRDLVWGYLSTTDDLILGSYNVPITAGQPAESHLLWRSESKAVFALDKGDGSLRWVYRPQANRIVSNIEIAFGDGRLFLIDGTSKADLARARRRRQKIKAELTLVALNLKDGSEIWRQDDVPLLGDRSLLSRLKSNITHLFMGQPNWGHLIYANGVVVYGANAAYDAASGKKLWQKTIRPGKLPIIYGDRIITSSCAYDLRTGKQCMTKDLLTGEIVPWRYSRSYGCGPVMGCQHVLFFRSGADGFFDMDVEGTTNFGGVRSGCARTLLAANGLLLHPQGYSGCPCCYNYKTNLALISAPEPGNTWYVLPRRASTGPIERLALNFGAPGDRKDPQGEPWLGFPRPIQSGGCPAPVTVSMTDAECTYRRRATGEIQGTSTPWVYSSNLQGNGRIAIGLVLQPSVVLPKREAAPSIDGKLDDACWKDVRAVPFENTQFSMLGASVDFRMFRDAENIYFAYNRKPLEQARSDVGPATLGSSDVLDIYVADWKRRVGIRLAIKRNGDAIARFGTLGVSRKTDPRWKGEWQYAVQEVPGGWAAEVALPIQTLTKSGMTLKTLQINCMSQNLTQCGLEGIFLTDPYYSVKFRCCTRFLRVVPPAAQAPPERFFTVRLHFAEVEDVKPGARVFDISLQGKPVLQGLDIVKAAGKDRAFVREFRGVKATDEILLDLTPAPGAQAPPVICGAEVAAEQ
ncbi:MAG: PQQ-binding-like beta-propeller repeat protein [Planctomycetes bacterium]|nr:PQQ-binding-like beta-propeller repeat protein [Planctomycetota bacterium]